MPLFLALLTGVDFADFATPSPASAAPGAESLATPLVPNSGGLFGVSSTAVPSSAFSGPWYAVWERHPASEFQMELYILLLLVAVIFVHFWGNRRNRKISRAFVSGLSQVLSSEFAYIGFSTRPETVAISSTADVASGSESNKNGLSPDILLRGTSHTEYVSYASGRNNVMFMHATISLQRRNNPLAWFSELVLSFFFESIPEPADSITLTMSPQPGKYDNFIWALVNKRQMRRWREERYDMSLTRTSDWEGLPTWCAVMGESKEAGDVALYSELRHAVVDSQDFLEYLIVTDQPKDKPATLAETEPKKRIILQLRMPHPTDAPKVARLVQAYIRLIDHLVERAHFRPEVTRKIKAAREDANRKMRRAEEEAAAEEREARRVDERKKERDAKLSRMTASEQKKFLEKEREKETRRGMKKQQRKA